MPTSSSSKALRLAAVLGIATLAILLRRPRRDHRILATTGTEIGGDVWPPVPVKNITGRN